ncbi:PaaI family thioesterase [Nocardia brasiliensis]|uniref:DUF4442 domain-containing protein n=1 Tax=Nocardia brasiliensis (strain ATCC 700358 / HUJEG-1) TaxID=1133849 RepID=K0F1D8_NOCB7|nr:YiiD C-terminal domain-containing protein [Nocardia brasiliensis]AFU02935.1 hypothetical protein O3I_024920 [Nocardia brasiliensis ATCC 700358]OCF86009.1 tetrameric acyl-CoA thioesterase [Nocardia brasiliensis]
MKVTPQLMKWWLNIWPPLLFSGIRVTEIADDWTTATIRLKVNRLNQNIMGAAFGGSLSAMTGPLFMVLLMQQIGPEYRVWDTEGTIKFIRPGKGTLTSRVTVPPAVVEQIRNETADGAKSLTWFETEIIDAGGATVAVAHRQVYARKKPAPEKDHRSK